MRARFRYGESGQAAVELVALLPLIATVGLAIGHVLAAEASRELAGHAAEAAAIAVGRGGDAERAARASLPEWSRERVQVTVDGRQVRVRLEPPAVVATLGDALATTAAADAGPKPAGASPPAMVEDDGAQPAHASPSAAAEHSEPNPSGPSPSVASEHSEPNPSGPPAIEGGDR